MSSVNVKPNKIVDLSKIEPTKKKIGKGGFATVYKVIDKDTKQYYAAKVLNINIEDASPEEMVSLYHEINIMSKLDHPYVLKFIGYSPFNFKNQNRPIIFTELALNGSLTDIIKLERVSQAPHEYTNSKKFQIIYGIAAGMNYLHQNEIINRDLKPDNILLDNNFLPRISDFGLSKTKNSQKSITLQSSKGIKGTYLYIAPETWNTEKYDKPGDVYAFALIVYEIITTKAPFEKYNSISQIFRNVVINNIRPDFDSSVPDSYRELIERCWSNDPSKRPTFEEIVKNLKEDQGFIIDEIDKDDVQNYIEDVDLMKSTYDPKRKVLKLEKIVKKDSKTFKLVAVDDDQSSNEENEKINESSETIKNENNEINLNENTILKQISDDRSAVSSLFLILYYLYLMMVSFFKMSKAIFCSAKNAIWLKKKEASVIDHNCEKIMPNNNIKDNISYLNSNEKSDEKSCDEIDSDSIDDLSDLKIDYIADDSPTKITDITTNINKNSTHTTVKDKDNFEPNIEHIFDNKNDSQECNDQRVNEKIGEKLDQPNDILNGNTNSSQQYIPDAQINGNNNDNNNSYEVSTYTAQSANNDSNTQCNANNSSTNNQDTSVYTSQATSNSVYYNQSQPALQQYRFDPYNYYNYYNSYRTYEYRFGMSYYCELNRQLMNHPVVNGHQRAVLISTGSYCPVHQGHFKLLDTASQFLAEEYNIDCILGIVSPTADEFVFKRFNSEIIPVKHRFECLRLACNEHNSEINSNGLVIVPDFWEGSYINFIDFPDVHRHFLNEITGMLPNEKLLVLYVCGADLFIKAECDKKYNFVGLARPGLKIDTPSNPQKNIYVCNDKKYTEFYYDATMAISLARKNGESISGLTYKSVEKYLTAFNIFSNMFVILYDSFNFHFVLCLFSHLFVIYIYIH